MMADLWTDIKWWKPVIDHVFLPRQLPGRQSDTLLQDEEHLLKYLTRTVLEYSHLVPTPVKTLFESWNELQGRNIPTPDGVSAALKQLKSGEMFGYFVRAQNCGLFFSFEKPTTFRQSPAHLTMCTFPASLPNSTIMSSDFEVAGAYPEQAIVVLYSELLTSHAIALQIVTLTNQEMLDALETSSKAGSKPVEVHEPPETLYISELLVSILANSESKLDSTFPTVCKKVRDNVQFEVENALIPFRRSGLWMTAKVILQLALVKSMGDKNGTLFYKILMNEFMRKICEDFGKLQDVDSDLGMHMIKKLARRMSKIKKMDCNQAHKTVVDQLYERVTQTILDLKRVMEKNWGKIIKENMAKLPLLEVYANDIIHTELPLVPFFQTTTGSNTANVFGLMAMYGEHREDVLLTKILESQIERKLENVKCQTSEEIASVFQEFCGQIISRCRVLIKDKHVISHLLDEEQEKEHEEEAEEEREICRPVPATPATHRLSPHVIHFVVTGDVMPEIQAKDIVPLHLSTTVPLTRDFVNVIIQNSVADRVDEFMRTPMWIITGGNGKILVLISPFEANELIPVARQAAASGIGLRMFSARLAPNQETLVNIEKLIISKPGLWSGFAEVQNNLLAPLYVFSGTLYFKNEAKQNSYCCFTGLIPRERTAKEQTAFKDGKITNNGFLLPSFRPEISKIIEHYCKFQEHPEPLIRGIIETRFGSFPQASHVSKVVCGSRRVEQFDK